MATKDEVGALRQCRPQRRNSITNPIAPWRVLIDSSRRLDRISCKPRKHRDPRARPRTGERLEEIAVVLGNYTAPTECIGYQRKHRAAGRHNACASHAGLPG